MRRRVLGLLSVVCFVWSMWEYVHGRHNEAIYLVLVSVTWVKIWQIVEPT